MIGRSRLVVVLALGLALCVTGQAGVVLSENFDDVSTITGWVVVNNSTSGGPRTSWFQGEPGVFTSQSGAPNSYVAANYLNAYGNGDVSNWAITPVLSVKNGAEITFYTRSEGVFPGDTLDVRLGIGSGTNVGSTTTSVGDFTTVLATIGGGSNYPTVWTKYTIMITGLSGITDIRLALRYWVTDTSVNGDYIGIDTLQVTDGIPEPSTVAFALSGLAVLLLRRLRAARRG